MKAQSSQILNTLRLNDYLLILLAVAGVFFAVVVDSLVLKLIGACATTIGIIATYVNLTQRFSEIVKSKKPKASTPDYQITVKKDTIGKRKTIENFENINRNIENQISKKSSTLQGNQEDETFSDDVSGEQIRIIRRFTNTQQFPESLKSQDSLITQKNNGEIKENETNLQKEDLSAVADTKTDTKTDTEADVTLTPNTSLAKEIGDLENQLILEPQKEKTQDGDTIETTSTTTSEQTSEQSLAKETHTTKLDFHLPEQPSSSKINDNLFSDIQIEEEPKQDYRYKDIGQNIIDTLNSDVLGDEEPRKEFEYFVSRLLLSLRDVANVNTTAFVLYNKEKEVLILESFVTNLSDFITSGNKHKISNDIVSQIIKNKKPEILSDINPNATSDLFFYYTKNTNIRSFIGIPVIYENSIIGAVIADSEENDAFDNNFISILGQYSKLISGLLKSYTQKYELSLDSKTLQAVKYFSSLIETPEISYNNVISFLIETVSKIIECSTVGVIVHNPEIQSWQVNQISSVYEQASMLLGTTIDNTDTLVWQAINENKTVFISPITDNITRVNTTEVNIKGGYFICLPLTSLNQTFGVLFIEGEKSSSLSSFDISVLQTITKNASFVIEKLQLLDLIKNNSIYDSSTGLLNPNAMYERIYRELERAKATGVHQALCLFRIDSYASVNQTEFPHRVILATEKLISLLSSNIREYDILGQVDDGVYCLMLIGINLDKALVWAEKIRTEFAMTIIEEEGKKFNATLSIGIASSNITETVEDLIQNAAKALNLSIEKTNSVQIFS